MRYKFAISSSTNPYENLAVERDLIERVEDDVIFFLWQNADTIVIGHNQDLFAECRADEFKVAGGTLARRYSGGGAVYHDLGNLCFSIICQEKHSAECQYQKLITRALRAFDLNPEYNGRNDLLLEGKKFSGNAFYNNGSVLCQHGTILVSTDIDRMTYFLTPDPRKLSRNGVRSVVSRVVNLSAVDAKITVEAIQKAFIDTTAAQPLNQHLDYGKYRDFFSSTEWVYGGKR